MPIHGVRALLIGLTGLFAAGCVSTINTPAPLDKELDLITAGLAGDYFSDANQGAREGRAIYLRIRNITPRLGHTHALYSEMRHDGPDGEFYRQIIYEFDESPDRTENRMRAYRVADPEVAAKLIREPGLYARGELALKPGLSDSCYTVWTKGPDHFEGYIDPARCQITGKRGDQRLIESRMRISPQSIGMLERGYDLDGNLLFGTPDAKLMIWPRVGVQENTP